MHLKGWRHRLRLLFVTVITCFYQSCSDPQSIVNAQLQAAALANQYFKVSTQVTIEVHYEPGAEPFVGANASGRVYWTILRDNLQAIFQYRSSPPILDVPTQLSEMHPLLAQGRTSWTSQDIQSLFIQNHQNPSSSSEARFYIYFLNGYYNDGSGPNTGTIGVQLTGTPIIAIFKSVVAASGSNPNGPVPKFVEQSTLVHEMGHALGFVNNGVPMTADYQDAAHGAHSNDPNCVMYYLNEGAGDLAAFIQKYLQSSSVTMWGPNVLDDARSISN